MLIACLVIICFSMAVVNLSPWLMIDSGKLCCLATTQLSLQVAPNSYLNVINVSNYIPSPILPLPSLNWILSSSTI